MALWGLGKPDDWRGWSEGGAGGMELAGNETGLLYLYFEKRL
jgi:hypothetical protein